MAFILLLTAGLLFPVSPVIAGLALATAFWAASHWKATVGETLELIVFYGALAGIISALI